MKKISNSKIVTTKENVHKQYVCENNLSIIKCRNEYWARNKETNTDNDLCKTYECKTVETYNDTGLICTENNRRFDFHSGGKTYHKQIE
jgi:hypothetical protein